MRTFARSQLLLILTALALAGGVGDGHACGGWGAVAGEQDLRSGWPSRVSAPEPPPILVGPPAATLATGVRVSGGDRPPPGTGRTRSLGTPAAGGHRRLAAAPLLAAGLAPLSVAHRARLSRSGALSSFGTSLPPPPLA